MTKPLKKKGGKKPRPSPHPQSVDKNVWYHENPASLKFIVYKDGVYTEFRVPASMLVRSLRRMGYKVVAPTRK